MRKLLYSPLIPGLLMACTLLGLFVLSKNDTVQASSYWQTYNTSNSPLPSNYVNVVTIDHDGSKWFGTVNGAAHFDGTNWTIYDASNSGLTWGVNEIAIGPDGSKWFAEPRIAYLSNEGAAVRFDGTTWTVYKSSNSGIPSNGVMSVAIESNGVKWFGGNERGGGVVRYDGANWNVFDTSNSPLPG